MNKNMICQKIYWRKYLYLDGAITFVELKGCFFDHTGPLSPEGVRNKLKNLQIVAKRSYNVMKVSRNLMTEIALYYLEIEFNISVPF